MSGKSRRNLWWLLSGLTLVILLVSAMLVTVQMRRASRFERIVQGSSGNVIWSDTEIIPRWLHEILPDAINHSFFDRAGIDFTIDLTTGRSPGITITDADWLALHEQLTPFRIRVTGVMLKGSQVGDETVATFDPYPNIEALDLSDTLVTDDSLKFIAKMTQLRILILDRTKVSGSDLSELRILRHLQYLGVAGNSLAKDARAELQSHLPEVLISDD